MKNLITTTLCIAIFLATTNTYAVSIETSRVYEALFTKFGSPNHTYVVMEDPENISDSDRSPEIETLVKSFQFESTDLGHNKKDFGNVRVHILDEQHYREIFNVSKTCRLKWKDFHRKFAHAGSLIQLSNVGFNADKSEAIILIHAGSGCLGSTWDFIIFSHKNGNWIFKQSINVGIS